jgi:hypothetical protein
MTNGRLLFAALVVVVLFFVAAGLGTRSNDPTLRPPETQKAASASAALPTSTEKLDRARAFEAKWRNVKAKKSSEISAFDLGGVLWAIDTIPADAPETAEAATIGERLAKDREAIRAASDAYFNTRLAAEKVERDKKNLPLRKAYANDAERRMLDVGRDFYFSVEGKDSSILRIRYVLMSRPLVHQMVNNSKIMDQWRDLGFNEVIFTDGYNNTWRQKL